MAGKIDFNSFKSKGFDTKVNMQINTSAPDIQYGDERVLNISVRNDGQPNLVKLRFLPTAHQSDVVDKNGNNMFHLVKSYIHFWKLGNVVFAESCPRTRTYNGIVNSWEKCPICESIRDYWDAEKDSPEKKEYDMKKAKVKIFANVYVYSDSLNPNNNGKVMILQMNNSKSYFPLIDSYLNGAKDKTGNILKAGKPLFDLFNSPDVEIMVTKSGEFSNYAIEFSQPTQFMNGDMSKIAEIFEKTHDLFPFMNLDKIKTYDGIIEVMTKQHDFSAGTISNVVNTANYNNSLKAEIEKQNSHIPQPSTIPVQPAANQFIAPQPVQTPATPYIQPIPAPTPETYMPPQNTIQKPDNMVSSDDFDVDQFFSN